MSTIRFALIAVAAAGCSSTPVDPNVNATHGSYLISAVLGCADCHTTPQANGLPSFDPSDYLAGGRELDFSTGGAVQKFFAPNLTSDPATGLGKWSDDEIKRAITHGIDNEGNALFPLMPYFAFANLSEGDLQSIVLFLRTLPPKVNQVPQDTFSLSSPVSTIDPNKIPDTTLPASDPLHASAENGRYLASVACLYCHTPTTGQLDPPLDLTRALAGGQLFPQATITTVSGNLTPDATGLQGWTADDVIATVRFDTEKGHGRPLCEPMPGGPNRDGDMIQSDLQDIANYLTTIAPVHNGPFGCTDGGVPFGLDQ